MAEGILGLGSSASTGLSQELIDKLKAAETKARIDPYDTKIETWDKELEKISEIDIKTKELLESIQDFDLFTSGTNAFSQVVANTTGTSAVFDAVDVGSLTEGTNSVTISQLAQRDVYQTSSFTDKDAQIAGGNDAGDTFSITIGGNTLTYSTVDKTYAQLAEEINFSEEVTASVEQVGDNSFRLAIKSTQSGLENKLTITQNNVDLGFGAMQSTSISDFDDRMGIGRITIGGEEVIANTEGMTYNNMIDAINNYTDAGGSNLYSASIEGDSMKITALDGSSVSIVEDGVNGLDFEDSSYILKAQNMNATVDGIEYDVSDNTITIQGNLSMTAIETGTSTISLQKDTTSILPALEIFVEKYNELVTLVDDELYSSDSSLEDPGSIRAMMNSIKDKLFGSYGLDEDKNIYSYGFGMDTSGHLSIDEDIFAAAITDDLDGLKTLFVGVAEKEGLATQLKTFLDALDGTDGILTSYGDSMVLRKENLDTDKEKSQTALDTKYSLMAQQFASYTAIISQMENSFGGMKLMMEQSSS